MTEQHDFKSALDDDPLYWRATHKETIQTALRLADKLQSGEVSEGMMNVLKNEYGLVTYKDIFKAMAAQMIKECE